MAQFEQYPNERRRSPRISGDGIKVEYSTDSNGTSATQADVKNICIHGICIFMPEVIEAKETISMKIHLPGSAAPIHAKGAVVWYSAGSRSGYYNVGIEFETMSEEDKKKLSDYIDIQLKK